MPGSPLPLLSSSATKQLAIIYYLEHQPLAFDAQLDARFRAVGVSNDVVDRLFENEKHVVANVGTHPQQSIALRHNNLNSILRLASISLANPRIRLVTSSNPSPFGLIAQTMSRIAATDSRPHRTG